MVTFGIDVSHHQPTLDFNALRRDGVEFVFIKSTEGASFVDPEFTTNLAAARAAELSVAAYHFVRGGAFAGAQAALIAGVVPRDVPVLLDVESGSGGVALARDLVDQLRARGYRVPLLYLPRWYWQELGQPSLAGLPPLWSSRYPDNVVDDLRREYAVVPPTYWNGYGGVDVEVLQFTSSARVAGYAPLDANAYRGTREQLTRLLGYEEEEPMSHWILGREQGGLAVWIGDLVTRRHVADPKELEGLQYWIGQRGGDPSVYEFEDLRVLGAPLATDLTDLKTRPVADVDEAALAAELQARGIGSVTDEVVAAIRAVFADAGQADE